MRRFRQCWHAVTTGSFCQPSATALVTSHLYGCARSVALTQAASCNRITLPLYTIIYPDAIASLEATVSSSTKWDNNGDHTALADLRHDAGLRRAYGQRWGPSLFTRRETEALIAELAAQTDRAKRGSQATSCALEVPTATVYSVSVTGGGQTGGGACGEHLPPLGRLPWDLVIYILLLAFAREQEAGPRLASTPAVPGQSP